MGVISKTICCHRVMACWATIHATTAVVLRRVDRAALSLPCARWEAYGRASPGRMRLQEEKQAMSLAFVEAATSFTPAGR